MWTIEMVENRSFPMTHDPGVSVVPMEQVASEIVHPHWGVSALLLPAYLILILVGVHVTFRPHRRSMTCHILRAHLLEINLLMAGGLVILLVLPLKIIIHICLLIHVGLTYQCTLHTFFVRLTQAVLFVSLPLIAAERLKRMWVFSGRHTTKLASQLAVGVSWALLVPVVGYTASLTMRCPQVDLDYQLCTHQADPSWGSNTTGAAYHAMGYFYIVGVSLTFVLLTSIYVVMVNHLRHRL